MAVSIDAILFDLDSTLLDGSAVRAAVVDTCRDLALHTEIDRSLLESANSQVWLDYWPTVVEDWMAGRISGESVSVETWRRTLSQCGLDDPGVVRQARSIQIEHEHAARRLYPDVKPLFSLIRNREVPVALITNGASDIQRAKLASLGIEDWFDVIVISGEIGLVKPDPRIFDYARTELGIGSGRSWYIGDSLAADVAGANAAGLASVWLNRNGHNRQPGDPVPDMEITSLLELHEELVR